eukprot:1682868-Alexandrium_andersonii.AAC.1
MHSLSRELFPSAVKSKSQVHYCGAMSCHGLRLARCTGVLGALDWPWIIAGLPNSELCLRVCVLVAPSA